YALLRRVWFSVFFDCSRLHRDLHSFPTRRSSDLLVDEEGNETYFGAAFRDKGLPNQIKDNVLNGEIYHGMAEFPQETFVTGFFANELENTIGVPFTYEGEQYALFIRPD